MRASTCCMAFAVASLSACGETAPTPAPIRPVRTVVVQKHVIGETVALTGHIRAQDEVNLAFRIDGKLTERLVNVGDRVSVGQLVGRIDPQNELNALRSAEADLAAAQAMLTQMQGAEARLRELLHKGIATRALYDQALQQLQTAQSQTKSAEARLRTAEDRRSYTELRADTAGAIIAKGAEPGEVVRAGQMIVQVARESNKDAIFDMPVQLIRAGRLAEVEVYLADNPNTRATGRPCSGSCAAGRSGDAHASGESRAHRPAAGDVPRHDGGRARHAQRRDGGRAAQHRFDAVERPAGRLGRRRGHEDRRSPTHGNCASRLELGDCCAGSAGW